MAGRWDVLVWFCSEERIMEPAELSMAIYNARMQPEVQIAESKRFNFDGGVTAVRVSPCHRVARPPEYLESHLAMFKVWRKGAVI